VTPSQQRESKPSTGRILIQAPQGHKQAGLVRLAGSQPASQQYFSLTPIQHQPAAISQLAVFFSHNKSVLATSHQPASHQPANSIFLKPSTGRNPAVRPRDHPAPAPSSSLSPAHATHALPLSLSLSLHDRLQRTDRPACPGRLVLFPGQRLAQPPSHPGAQRLVVSIATVSAGNRGRERAAEHQRLNERTVADGPTGRVATQQDDLVGSDGRGLLAPGDREG
jgi:hypothetical protein